MNGNESPQSYEWKSEFFNLISRNEVWNQLVFPTMKKTCCSSSSSCFSIMLHQNKPFGLFFDFFFCLSASGWLMFFGLPVFFRSLLDMKIFNSFQFSLIKFNNWSYLTKWNELGWIPKWFLIPFEMCFFIDAEVIIASSWLSEWKYARRNWDEYNSDTMIML